MTSLTRGVTLLDVTQLPEAALRTVAGAQGAHDCVLRAGDCRPGPRTSGFPVLFAVRRC